jgi:hypothetical protein
MKQALKNLNLALVGLLTAPVAFAQTAVTPFNQPFYFASSFNTYSIPSQLPNTFQFAGRSICTESAQGLPFFAFNTNAPVYVQDQTSANSEVLTPSAVINTAGSCGIAISPTNQHRTFWLRSGTGGLQEALNTLQGGTQYPALVILDRNFWAGAAAVPGTTPSAIIAAAKGNATVMLEDITTAPATFYVAGSTSSYVTGTWTNVKPTAAAGAGAGTAPTISDAGTAGNGVVSLTSGTATTTGTLFTLTWPTTGNFLYAPSCTVNSVGTNSYTTFTKATTFAASAATLTVTVATTAPVASTAYKFAYSCQ